MITKTRSRRQAFLKYLPIIPLLVVVLVIFSNWDAVAHDSMNLLENEVIDGVEVMAPSLAEDFDPKVLQKTLSAILYKRSQVTTNQDAKLAKGFAKVHDEWAAKYPDHKDEIRKIAEEVAAQYELSLKFDKGIINTAFFKKPFRAKEGNSGIVLRSDSEKDIKIGTPTDKEPYVIIDDVAAPADWKNTVKPEMIESIDVLKDEAALKAYGEKGKDGVIRIRTKNPTKDDKILPRFPGCENIEDAAKREKCAETNLLEHIYENLEYPEIARKYGVEGVVVARYVVDKTGKIKDVRITRDLGAKTGAAVKEVLRNLPPHIPGTINGEPVDIEMTLPVKFKVTEKGKKERVDIPEPKVIISNLDQVENPPLFIVDDEIVERGAHNQLDPDEIESIEVLKGEKAIAAYGQKGANGVVKITTKLRFYDTAPIFPGCEGREEIEREHCSGKNFLLKIYKNIKYPAVAREQHIEGMVLIKYTIEADGSIQNPIIARDIGGGCGEAALSVFQHLPNNWTPATKDGKAIAVEMLLPIRYKLESDDDTDSPAKTPAKSDKAISKDLNLDHVKVAEEVVVVGYATQKAKSEVFTVVEEMPRFPGGCEDETDIKVRKSCADKTMLQFVYENIQYTKAAKDAKKEGMVVANFVVTKEGELTDLSIYRSLGYGLDEQVLDAIKKMPKWIPGKQRGKAVDVSFNLPVRFMLKSTKVEKSEKVDKVKMKKAEKEPTTVHVNGPTETITPAKSTLSLQNFKAAPNPSNGLINLRFQAEAKPLSVRILSANGQEVYKNELPQFGGNFDEQIDLQDAPKGTLFISVLQGDRIHSSTIILQ